MVPRPALRLTHDEKGDGTGPLMERRSVVDSPLDPHDVPSGGSRSCHTTFQPAASSEEPDVGGVPGMDRAGCFLARG